MRYAQSGCGWNIKVRSGIHNQCLAEDLDAHNILCHLRPGEIKLVNNMTKDNMTLGYIMGASKDVNVENLTNNGKLY